MHWGGTKLRNECEYDIKNNLTKTKHTLNKVWGEGEGGREMYLEIDK